MKCSTLATLQAAVEADEDIPAEVSEAMLVLVPGSFGLAGESAYARRGEADKLEQDRLPNRGSAGAVFAIKAKRGVKSLVQGKRHEPDGDRRWRQGRRHCRRNAA
jgi:hypothetical protein